MQIKIMKDANLHYIATLGRYGVINWKWVTIMELVSEQILEVETDYLFNDQFNTAGMSEALIDSLIVAYRLKHGDDFRIPELKAAKESLLSGLRIMEGAVDAVIDDIRPSKMKCHYCGHNFDITDVCPNCGKTEYLKPLISLHTARYNDPTFRKHLSDKNA